MLKNKKKCYTEYEKDTNIYSYYKDGIEAEYFKLPIGLKEYYIKTNKQELQEYYVYDLETEQFRYLTLREKVKLETEFKKEYSLFKEKEIYEKQTNMLPLMFYRARIKANKEIKITVN